MDVYLGLRLHANIVGYRVDTVATVDLSDPICQSERQDYH
jgi:hypothetical protein